MKKIPSLFKRNYDGDRLVRDEITEGCEWVVNGEGVATQKIDGTCCLIKDGMLYKRYDVKKGKKAPEGFIPAQEPDEVTGHWPGWVVTTFHPEDKYHLEAKLDLATTAAFNGEPIQDGTYELVGPKINKNPEKVKSHILVKHGTIVFEDCPRTFNEIKEWLEDKDIEGIVWHHPDGRMAKIKKRDFGMERSVK